MALSCAFVPIAGVMIEVPAAALCAAQILEQADFASIATNDLSRYTFAAGRPALSLRCSTHGSRGCCSSSR